MNLLNYISSEMFKISSVLFHLIKNCNVDIARQLIVSFSLPIFCNTRSRRQCTCLAVFIHVYISSGYSCFFVNKIQSLRRLYGYLNRLIKDRADELIVNNLMEYLNISSAGVPL